MIQNKKTLKTYFQTGDKPTQEQYEDLIDSLSHQEDNKILNYVPNEVLKLDSSKPILRFYNGTIYEFIGNFDEQDNTNFTTLSIENELGDGENSARWVNKLATFPPVDFVVVTPKSIQPLNTKTLQFSGSNFINGTTIRFSSPNITIDSYTYLSENIMLVEITSTSSTLEEIDVYVDNGSEKMIDEKFSISLGDVIVPESLEYPFEPKDLNLIYGLGAVENESVTAGRYSGYFGEIIPQTSDFILKYRVGVGAVQHSWFQMNFAISKSVTQTAADPHSLAIKNDTDTSLQSVSGFGSSTYVIGDLIEIRRVGNLYKLYLNSEYKSQKTISINNDLYMYFYMAKANNIYDIELTIL